MNPTRPFRPHSLYLITCECRQVIESASADIICPKCGAVIRVEAVAK